MYSAQYDAIKNNGVNLAENIFNTICSTFEQSKMIAFFKFLRMTLKMVRRIANIIFQAFYGKSFFAEC